MLKMGFQELNTGLEISMDYYGRKEKIMIITFIPIGLFLLSILTGIGIIVVMLKCVIDSIVDILFAIIALATIITLIVLASKYHSKSKYYFVVTVLTIILYIPMLIHVYETLSMDRMGYLLPLESYDYGSKLYISIGIFLLIVIISHLISYFKIPIISKPFCALPLIAFALFSVLSLNTVRSSYNDYYMDYFKDKKTTINYVKEDTQIYMDASFSPLTIYPLLSPKKVNNGELKKGEQVYIISERSGALGKYVYIRTDTNIGIIERSKLKIKVKTNDELREEYLKKHNK